jgi:hypothetical protein
MKRLLNWLKREFEPDAAAICWLRHSAYWQYVRHAGEVDADVGEYYCPRCHKNRMKREWL